MKQFVAMLAHDMNTLQRWLQALQPDDVEVAGRAALTTTGGALDEDGGGRARGGLTGVLFNDLEIGDELQRRGLAAAGGGQGQLVATTLGQFGPAGLAGLRFQGVAAALHRSMRGVLLAGGAVGVTPLYLHALQDGWIATTDLRAIATLDGDLHAAMRASDPPLRHWAGAATGAIRTIRIVAGSGLLLTEAGPRIERVRWQPRAEPYFRRAQPHLAAADPATALLYFADALTAAVEATERALGPTWLGPAHNDCQRWLAEVAAYRGLGGTTRGASDAGCRWSLLGSRTLSERMRWPDALQEGDEQQRIARLQCARDEGFRAPAIQPPLPEPLPRDDPARCAQRLLRYTAFSHALAARGWQRAASQGWTVAMPHLDPRVLATTGALPSATLQAMVDAPPRGELSHA